MFLNFTSMPDREHDSEVQVVADRLKKKLTKERIFFVGDGGGGRTHFRVPHHDSGIWVFPFQPQELLQTAGLQPRRSLPVETQRAQPLTFDERLQQNKPPKKRAVTFFRDKLAES